MEGPAPARRRTLQVELAVMAFVAVVPSLVIALEGLTDPTGIDLDIGVLDLIATLLSSLGPAAIALYLLWRDGRLHAAGFARRKLRFVAGYGALGWVCCMIAIWSLAIAVAVLIAAFGADPSTTGGDASYELTVGTALAGLAVALTAGFGEEVVFRAYAISRMQEAGYSRRAALVVPWAVFAVLHLYQGPIAVVLIGAVAAVFVWLYQWQRSIWPVMVAHALFDITQLLLAAALT
jgi:membrane protease YdiL (CAAX protease family)